MHVNKNNQDSCRASGLQNHTLMWAGHMPPCLLELWAWPEQGGPSQALVAFPGLPSPCSGGQKAVPARSPREAGPRPGPELCWGSAVRGDWARTPVHSAAEAVACRSAEMSILGQECAWWGREGGRRATSEGTVRAPGQSLTVTF